MTSIRSDLAKTKTPPEYYHVLQDGGFLSRSMKKIFEVYCKIILKFYCPMKVIGRENIPINSSFIFCSNHSSHMDSGILMTASGLPFNKFAMIAAKDYFFSDGKKDYLKLLMNLIPVKRGAERKSILDHLAVCRDFTRSGNRNLIVYPEGTRTLTGKIQPFKKGAAVISVELGLPVVPAFIKGSFDAWPKGKIIMKPSKITIRIGKPIIPESYICTNCDEDNFHAYKTITEELESKIHELSNGA